MKYIGVGANKRIVQDPEEKRDKLIQVNFFCPFIR